MGDGYTLAGRVLVRTHKFHWGLGFVLVRWVVTVGTESVHPRGHTVGHYIETTAILETMNKTSLPGFDNAWEIPPQEVHVVVRVGLCLQF